MNVTEAFARLRQQYMSKPCHGRSIGRILDRWKTFVDNWDKWSATYHEAVRILDKEISSCHEMIQELLRKGEVSEQFRRQPNKSWEGSYTKKVVDELESDVMPFGNRGSHFCARVRCAINLLRDYHNTMHVVYEERDAARKRLADHKQSALAERYGGPEALINLDNVRLTWSRGPAGEEQERLKAEQDNLRMRLAFVTVERDTATKALADEATRLDKQLFKLGKLNGEVIELKKMNAALLEQRDRAVRMELDRCEDLVNFKTKVKKTITDSLWGLLS